MADLTRINPHAEPTLRPASIVDQILDPAFRPDIVGRIVNVSREVGGREDRRIFWKGLVFDLTARAKSERTPTDRIALALRILTEDVKTETQRRDRLADEAAQDFFASFRRTAAEISTCRIIEFPGEPARHVADTVVAALR